MLLRIAELWENDRKKVKEYSDNLVAAVQQLSGLRSREGDPAGIPQETVIQVVDGLARAWDRDTGGLLSGSTNKFPPSMAMSLMLRAYHSSPNESPRIGDSFAAFGQH